MARKRITDRMLVAGPKDDIDEIWDEVVPSFGYRKTAKNRAGYFISYRDPSGRKRRLSIGKYPALPLEDARQRALALLTVAARGEDLKVAKAALTAPDASAQDTTFGKLLEQYLTTYAEPRLRTAGQIRKALTLHALPALGELQIAQIEPHHIYNLVRALAKTSPIAANRVHAMLSSFFSWCCKQLPIPISVNPAKMIDKPTPERSRDRVLTNDEIQSVLKACREMNNHFGHIFEILIRTGLRRSEVAKLTWDRVDLEGATLSLRDEDAKNAQGTIVPLPPAVILILSGINRTGEYVFTTTGHSPVSGFSRAMTRLRQATGIEDIRPHDFRRTFATNLAQLRVQPHVIEACLNHTTGKVSGVAKIYNRHQYFDERQEAMLLLESYLDGGKIVSVDRHAKI
jgi:integrase